MRISNITPILTFPRKRGKEQNSLVPSPVYSRGRARVGAKNAGFTLLEILVAVFIVGIISVVMLRGLESAINTKNHLERNAIRLQNLEFALALLNSDIQNIVNQPIIGSDGAEIVPVLLHPDNSQLLEFTRGGVANPLGAPRSTLLRVGYSWEAGKLIRTTWSTLNRTSDTQIYTRVLLTGVTSLQWRFLSGTTNFAANNWTVVWPSASMFGDMPLPRAVEITLKINGWGEVTRIFVVNAQNPLRQVGLGTP
jgi:general secretion pathway protein J